MATHVVMILGSNVWTRDSRGWQLEPFELSAEANTGVSRRLGEIVAESPLLRTVLVFEPREMAHECVETPKVGRAVFASLARIRSDHPVVASMNLGWGIEWPEPMAGGTYSTLIHSELSPGLVYLRDACLQTKCRLVAVWTPYTAIEALLKARSSQYKVRHGIILAPSFVAIATYGLGRRSFRAWAGPLSDRDWKAVSIVIGDFEVRKVALNSDTESRKSGIVVISDLDPAKTYPFWNELRGSGRVEAIVGIDALAESATKIPVGHPGNLMEVFPRMRNLDPYLIAASVAGFAAFAALGVIAQNKGSQFEKANTAIQWRLTELNARLNTLKSNQRDMLLLQKQMPDSSDSLPTGRRDALSSLAAAIPDALTLTSLLLARDGEFEIEALIVGVGFDPESARASLANSGFVPDSDKGWVYDPVGAKLRVRGRYNVSRR